MYNDLLLSVAPNIDQNEIMKTDLGANKTYLQPKQTKHHIERSQLNNGPFVTLLNHQEIQAIEGRNLQLKKDLSTPALLHLKLTSISLLSIGQLYNQGCIAIFTINLLSIYKKIPGYSVDPI